MRYETTHTLLVSDYRPAAHMDEIRDDTYTVGEFLREDEGLYNVSGDEDQL